MPRKKAGNGAGDALQAERRIAILDAAAAVFAQKGYHRARTRDIAAAAGVAEGTIFNYFPSKRDLLFAMLERIVAATLPEMFAGIDVADTPAMIKTIIHNRLATVERNRETLAAVAPELFSDRELREAFYQQVFLPTVRPLLPFIARLFGRPEMRDANPRVVMGAVFGGIGGAFLINQIETFPVGAPLTLAQIADQLARLYTYGLVRPEMPELGG